MRDSKPQRCVQHHKLLKVTRNAINRDKHINEASKQTFANNLFEILCKCTQGMIFNRNICGNAFNQRWSPRGRPWPRGRPQGQILKSLASKVKFLALVLASRPQVLENWPVLGSRTALFFGKLKFCGAVE